jgi:PEP-CTERM motif
MSKITVIFASLALLGSTQAFGQTVKITDSNQGRYDLNGLSSGASGPLENYIAGQIVSLPDPADGVPGEVNNFADFFSFDVSGVKPGTIRSGSIEISGGQNVFTSGPNGVFSLYASPVDPSTDVTGFEASLTPGNLIGSVSVTNGGTISSDNPTLSDVVVQLNATGLADLAAAAGTPGAQFFVGGTFTGADPYVLLPGPGGLTFANVFNGSGNVPGAALTLAVPEPSTWAMILAGFAGLAAAGRVASRRRTAIA